MADINVEANSLKELLKRFADDCREKIKGEVKTSSNSIGCKVGDEEMVLTASQRDEEGYIQFDIYKNGQRRAGFKSDWKGKRR